MVEYHPGPHFLRTTIRDTGVGMAQEQIDKLFQLYANIEHANIYNPQGMGLGLSLCKRLSMLLGGDINIESDPDQGSYCIICY